MQQTQDKVPEHSEAVLGTEAEQAERSVDPEQVRETAVSYSEHELQSKELDLTAMPAMLAKRFDEMQGGSELRPMTITASDEWTRWTTPPLARESKRELLDAARLVTERDKAFDLVDALSRSGGLSIEHASLHVVVATAHCFSNSLISTVIQESVNPIETAECAVLIAAQAIHNKPAAELLSDWALPLIEER